MAHPATQIGVSITDPRNAHILPYPQPPALKPGQILIKVSKFVLTANTVTYAMAGQHPELQYFAHYPFPDPNFALSPCWGTGIIADSRCTGLEVGLRVHGFYAMAPYVVLTPKPAPTQYGQFVDMTEHRISTIAAYRTYFIKPMATASEDYEDLERTDGILFSTGWGMAHSTSFLKPTPPHTMVLTSASSRTAICAAFSAKHSNNGAGLGFQVVGLTSRGNIEYVRSTGLYDEVYTYDDVSSMDKSKTIVVQDCSGSPTIQASLRQHYESNLIGWSSVGLTHVNDGTLTTPSRDLKGGAKAQSFLVFVALREAAAIYGISNMQEQLSSATRKYIEWKLPNFQTERSFGAQAALRVFQKTVANQSDPGVTYVCSMWPDATAAGERAVVAGSKM